MYWLKHDNSSERCVALRHCLGTVCDQLRLHWCPQRCDFKNLAQEKDNFTCTCYEDHGFKDLDGDGLNCIPDTGLLA